VGSLVFAKNAAINVSGGSGAKAGGKGRFIFGKNAGADFTGSLTGATRTDLPGPLSFSPYVGAATPNRPAEGLGVKGGAEA
jgi:hypothetical protein